VGLALNVDSVILALRNVISNESIRFLSFVTRSRALAGSDIATREEFGSVLGKAFHVARASMELHCGIGTIIVTLWGEGADQSEAL
jgi:hypothetical protein